MHSFLWTGKDEHGNEKREVVEAENADAARTILAARGWTELRLLRDELGEVAQGLIDAPAEYRQADKLTIPTDKEPGFFEQWGRSLSEAKWTLFIASMLLAVGLYQGHWIAIVVGAVGLVVIAGLYPVISFFFRQGSREFARMNHAKVWGRWPEVLKSVERLRRIRNRTRIGLNDWELARVRAMALAAMGRLDEGLREFAPYENSSVAPHWMYLSQLANVYDAAKQSEKALELRQQAAAEKPDNGALWVDLALTNVRRLNRPADARAALSRAEALQQSELAAPFMDYARGLIAWREGNLAEARTRIEAALAGIRPLTGKPLVQGVNLMMQSHLAAVLAGLGITDVAMKFFAKNREFLTAHHEDELLQISDSLKTSNTRHPAPTAQ